MSHEELNTLSQLAVRLKLDKVPCIAVTVSAVYNIIIEGGQD